MLARRFPVCSLAHRCYSTTVAVSASSLRFASNSNGKSNTEDADDIAKENKLRQMFENKTRPSGNGGFMDQLKQVHQQALQFAEQKTAEAVAKRKATQSSNNGTTDSSSSSSSSSSSTGSGDQQQQQQKPQVPSWFGPSQTFWTMMIYLTASYSTFLVWQLSDDQSFVSLTQGVPHWANGPYEESAYMLFRIIYSMRDQRRIQQEFEAVAPMAPNSSFLDFLNQRYAGGLSGNTCSFPETVALMSAALRQDFGRNTAVIAQAAKAGRDSREKIDGIANALRGAGFRPMYTASTSSSSSSSPSSMALNPYQQQQQQQMPISPYSAPIPPQLLQQAQGMHPAGFSGYGNPQMLQAWQNQVYNPYYAATTQQQNQQNQQASSSQQIPVVNLSSGDNATTTPVESK